MTDGQDLRNIQDLKDRVSEIATRDSAQRAAQLSFLLAVIFTAYGFTSLEFIQKFAPDVTLWSNLWPRLLISGLPLALLGILTRGSRMSDRAKLYVWIVGFSLILHATAWIHIWPIALKNAPEILTYVHSANIFLYAVVFSIIAPPGRILVAFALVLSVIFVGPFHLVAHGAADAVLFRALLNDSFLGFAASLFLGRSIHKLRCSIAKLEIEKELEASKFLGPVISRAIFEDESERLTQVRCDGFIVSMDIRDSTELQKKHGSQWLAFRKEYFALVSRLVGKHGGYIQKTVGDAHVINFGVMDYGADLSDIPGIEAELARAERRRIERASRSTFSFLEDFFQALSTLSMRHFPSDPVLVGAGVDRGILERSVQGDSEHVLELDVNGDAVNCATRLQEYSKLFRSNYPDCSLLVVSPRAAALLDKQSCFEIFSTATQPVRNYPHLEQVLARAFPAGDAPAANLRAA